MKKILLLSDTHSYIDEQILKFVKQADEVWHAGDIGEVSVVDTIEKWKPLRGVYGNIDDNNIRLTFPLDNRFIIEGVSIWMTHIGGHPHKYRPRVREILQKNPPKLFIAGHSHILKVQFDKTFNLLYLNPGAAGKYGFHKIRTMIRFSLCAGTVKNLEVIELGKRS